MHVKRGYVFFIFSMSLFACRSIYQGLDPERFSDESRGRRESCVCLALIV